MVRSLANDLREIFDRLGFASWHYGNHVLASGTKVWLGPTLHTFRGDSDGPLGRCPGVPLKAFSHFSPFSSPLSSFRGFNEMTRPGVLSLQLAGKACESGEYGGSKWWEHAYWGWGWRPRPRGSAASGQLHCGSWIVHSPHPTPGPSTSAKMAHVGAVLVLESH